MRQGRKKNSHTEPQSHRGARHSGTRFGLDHAIWLARLRRADRTRAVCTIVGSGDSVPLWLCASDLPAHPPLGASRTLRILGADLSAVAESRNARRIGFNFALYFNPLGLGPVFC